MSNESDDTKNGESALEELNNLLEEFANEINASIREDLFKMAQLLIAAGVKTEPCQVVDSKDNKNFALMIPTSEFTNLRKLIFENVD